MTKTMAHPDQGGLTLRGGSFFPECYKTALWRPPRMADLPSWAGAKRIGLDCETKDPDLQELGPGVRRPDTLIAGISFAIEGGPRHYLPIAHEGGGNMEEGREQVVRYLIDQFKTFDGDVVGANLPYDLDWLWEYGVAMPKVHRFYDVQVADPLLYELHDHYSLEAIAKRRGFEGKDEEDLREAARQLRLHPKKDIYRMNSRFVGPYAEVDALRPLEILRHQENEIVEQGLEAAWDMESRLLPILVRMTRRGINVNEDRLAQVEEWTKRREAEHFAVVKRETGIEIPVGQSLNVDLLKRALTAVDLQDCIGTAAKGGDSVTKLTLEGSDHVVAKAIVKARQVATLRTTFVNGTRRHLVNGKIHCTFNQIRRTDDDNNASGVAYGRLSASHPNMQNQPGNSRFSGDNEVGPMWRSIYQEDWTACDLKQQEPKWSFHFGALMEERGVEGVTGALALCKLLNENPQMDTYEPLVNVTGFPRPRCKVMWLARAYGKGNGNMCADLGFPTEDWVFVPRRMKSCAVNSEDGQKAIAMDGHKIFKGPSPEGLKVIDDFDASMPFLKRSAKLAEERAKEVGYVKLISNRRCHFEQDESGQFQFCNKGFNRIIQGSAAEQTKEITIAASDAGFDEHLILQVHDELDYKDLTPKQRAEVAEVMAHAVPMKVPTVVDVECGPSWGESMGIEYKDASGAKKKVQYRWGMSIVSGEPVYREGIL